MRYTHPAGRQRSGRAAVAAVLAIGLLCVGALTQTPRAAASGGTGSSGAVAGPTHVGQTWEAYVADGGRLDVALEILPSPATTGARPDVTELPGEVRVLATSPTGVQQATAQPWSVQDGALVEATFEDPGLVGGVWSVQVTATTASGDAWPSAWASWMAVDSWRITPRDADGTAHAGRVWTERYTQTNSGLALKGVDRWDQTHYVLSASGVTYRTTSLRFNGWQSVFTVDNLGMVDADCQPIHRTTVGGEPGVRRGSTCPDVVKFRIFFEVPDAAMPATARFHTGRESWVMPVYRAPSFGDLTWSQTERGTTWGGELEVTLAGQPGTVEIRVDVDDDGEFEGPRDVRLTQVLALGTTAVAWDGRDGVGAPVPLAQAVGFQAELTHTNELHLVSDDVEYREGGVELEALSGPQAGSMAVWWDDRATAWCQLADGVVSARVACTGSVPQSLVGEGVDSTGGVHGWGVGAGPINADQSTWGDGKHVDNWAIARDSAISQVLRRVGGVEVTKTADTDTLAPGDTTTHTWTVSNTGEVDLLGVEVVDDLAGVLPAGVIDTRSVTTTAGEVDLDLPAQALTWAGDLAAGAAATVTYALQTDPDVLAGEIVDTVSVTGWDARASVTQTVLDPPAAPTPSPTSSVVPAGHVGEPEPEAGPVADELAVTGAVIWAALAAAVALVVGGLAARRYTSRRRTAARGDLPAGHEDTM
ncbi:MAG: DUF11 domain-containing protein [Micrococcales bacterium]|nr:DUF11 domain-containing protein [Micrococcales bacterium]